MTERITVDLPEPDRRPEPEVAEWAVTDPEEDNAVVVFAYLDDNGNPMVDLEGWWVRPEIAEKLALAALAAARESRRLTQEAKP